MKSMTGYGAGKSEENGRSFSVEIKSVNHRYNDLSVKLPRNMLAFEDPIRKAVASKISRGKIDVFVNYESTAEEDSLVLFNETLGDNVFAELNKIKKRYDLKDEITLSMLCKYPNVIAATKKDGNGFTVDSDHWRCLETALGIAVLSFVDMRQKEGEALRKDISSKIDEIEAVTIMIDEKAPDVVLEYRKKLEQRLADVLLEGIDEQRLMQEIAVFADKSAIDEELTRLKSHIKQFRNILDETVPIGKKLDFLVQEMIRESNTIGSKSNNLEITNYVINLKALIEKIREQTQNIE